MTEPCLNSNRCVASNTGPIAVKFDQHAPNSDEEIKRQVINNSALKDAVYQDNRRSLASNPSKLLNEITEQEPIRKFGNTRAFFNEQMVKSY